ncbi:MAG: hypothetical protein JWO03_1033 [Bacteroidetes bacterium]|nr:hypothetical protein [Bacteroidota bacterium]
MKRILIAVILLCTLNACHRSCNCSPYEICLEGKCICGEWTEGSSCTPMRNKFVGTYAGTLTIDSLSTAQTLVLYAGNDQMTNYTFFHATPLPYPARLSGIRVLTPYAGVFFASILLPDESNIYLDNFHPVDCGSALLSPDGKDLTMTYHPLHDTTIIDFGHTYVFTGRKQ